MHVENTSDISSFQLHHDFIREAITGQYLLVGIVGVETDNLLDLNKIIN